MNNVVYVRHIAQRQDYQGELNQRRPKWPYVYFWNRQGRKGQPCDVLARGKMNSCLVRFPDGYTMVTSRNAIRRADRAKARKATNLPDRL